VTTPCSHRTIAVRTLAPTGPSRRWALLSLALSACGGALNAGSDQPLDTRNPVILCNDGATDNWQGEYAALLAGTGAISLSGIIISTGGVWSNLQDNLSGWQEMMSAASQSGLSQSGLPLPTPMASASDPLVEPADGNIHHTVFNASDGANLILTASLASTRPLVVITGGRLTDIAEAYVLDPTVANRIFVVSSLGSLNLMGTPNGEMDPWADVIVSQQLRYIQVSDFQDYDQTADLNPSILAQLPENPFTDWIKKKQPGIWTDDLAADQVAVAAFAIPGFVSALPQHVAPVGTDSSGSPILVSNAAGPVQVIAHINPAPATARFRAMLLDPTTFRTD